MRTLEGRARNVNSLINASSNNSCGGPNKSGVVQASSYPRIPKGTLLSRAPDQQNMVCSMMAGSRQYRYQAPKKLLG